LYMHELLVTKMIQKMKLEKRNKHGEIYSQTLLYSAWKKNVAMSHQTTFSAISRQPKTNVTMTVNKYTPIT